MKHADRTNPILIKVTSNGETLGHITPLELRAYMNGASNTFTPKLVEQFNAYKASINEPERAEIVIND